MATTLDRLVRWYQSNCNGDWEHSFGLTIGTLDNPGWSFVADLEDTPLANRPFELVADRYEHESDWMRCWKEGAKFHARCGPTRLEDALIVFLAWIENAG